MPVRGSHAAAELQYKNRNHPIRANAAATVVTTLNRETTRLRLSSDDNSHLLDASPAGPQVRSHAKRRPNTTAYTMPAVGCARERMRAIDPPARLRLTSPPPPPVKISRSTFTH